MKLIIFILFRGNFVNIYEKFDREFTLIGKFTSARKAANFLNISNSTVRKYTKSGQIFKDKYKFLPATSFSV